MMRPGPGNGNVPNNAAPCGKQKVVDYMSDREAFVGDAPLLA